MVSMGFTGENAKPALASKSTASTKLRCNAIIKESIVCFEDDNLHQNGFLKIICGRYLQFCKSGFQKDLYSRLDA